DKARTEDAQEVQAAVATGWGTIIRRLPGIIVLDTATSFAGGALGVLTVIIAVDSLGAGEAATGLLNAATGIGGIAAGLAAGWIVLRRLDVGIVAGSIIAAVGLLVLGTTRDLGPALLSIGVAVGAILLLDVILATVLQRLVPDEERGRAMGFVQIPGGLASIVGAFTAPLLASQFGVGAALVVIAIVSAILGIAAVVVLRPTGALLTSGLDPRRLE